MKKVEKEIISLTVFARDVVGKKVKKLRAEGKLPANIYGEDFKSTSIWMPVSEFAKVYKMAGETQVVYLHLDKNEYPTLIDGVAKHPLTGDLLHVDFKKISLKKKIENEVPVVFVGESEAIAKKKGDLTTIKDVLLVLALPNLIPSQIEVDLTPLLEVDDEITVAQLPKSEEYEFVDPDETVIVKISEHKEESTEPDVTAEMPEITEETPSEESSEEETPSETKEEPADTEEK